MLDLGAWLTPALMKVERSGPLCDLVARYAGKDLEDFRASGGLSGLAAARASGAPVEFCRSLEASGLRGRGGAGFPVGLKWRQLAAKEGGERYLVCNANGAWPGGHKERHLLGSSPYLVLEAVALAAWATRATRVWVAVGAHLEPELDGLRLALREAEASGSLGAAAGLPTIEVVATAGSWVAGEETAVLEQIEGRRPQPRRKPPLPTRNGLFGVPTVVSNLESMLAALWVARHGFDALREQGTRLYPGTAIFTLLGDVVRPGLYELPFGFPLEALLWQQGGGPKGAGQGFLGALPGGLSGRFAAPEELGSRLDPEAERARGGDLGGGMVIAVGEQVDPVELATQLARFYADGSCRRCQPCADGTARALFLLENLDRLDEPAIDLSRTPETPTKPRSGLRVLAPAETLGAVSYTDTAAGLDKIRLLCEWYRHRGDCRFSAEAARGVVGLLEAFEDRFEARRAVPRGGAMASDPRSGSSAPSPLAEQARERAAENNGSEPEHQMQHDVRTGS